MWCVVGWLVRIVGLVMNVCDDKQVEEAVEVVNEYTDSLWAVVNNVSETISLLPSCHSS